MNMTAASVEDHGRNDMGELSDDEGVMDDYDIATLHERNAVLKERATVKSFQEEIDECKSLADDKTRNWLTDFPFYRRKEAFPLFTDGEQSRDDSTDYQLHPHYTLLEFSKTAVHPHNSLCRLQKGDVILDDPGLVVGVGRLFVNIRNGKGGRITKWTGYEVFVDQKLAVWVVFDRSSNNPRAAGWYPEPCELLPPILPPSNNKQNIDIACFLSSLQSIGHAQSTEASQNGFEKARDMVINSRQLGKMTVCQVERSEAKRLLEAEQNTVELVKRIHEEILDAAWFEGRKEGWKGQKLNDTLDKYKDKVNLVKEAIKENVVRAAVGNSTWGEEVLLILLGQFKDEVGKSISENVIAYAARNPNHGGKIMTILVDKFKEKVHKSMSSRVLKEAASNGDCGAPLINKLLKTYPDTVEHIDINVIHATVLNGGSGEKILELLFQADDQADEKRVRELCLRAVKHEMPGWPEKDRNNLMRMLENTGRCNDFRLVSGIEVQSRHWKSIEYKVSNQQIQH